MSWTRHEVCFGLSADSGRTVFTDEVWEEFVRTEIVPRFPDGFTVYTAKGYWREGEMTVSEPSRILMVVASDTPETRKKLDAVAAAYLKTFRQESVLRIETRSKVEFQGGQ